MTSTSASSTPNSLFPTLSLPPSARDFEIHRLALVELLSTRRIAEQFKISQTRVRQIIGNVAEWMTEMLPLKSEQDIEKEKRYAIHLAAAQLQHQIETLQNYWDGSGDPKYQRQQTRAVVALARLGVSSHHLDSLASMAQPDDRRIGVPPVQNESEPNPSASDPTLPASPTSSPLRAPHSEFRTSFPPSEDCSPNSTSTTTDVPPPSAPTAATPSPEHDLLLTPAAAKDVLAGLDIMEKRLLNMIDYAYNDKPRQEQFRETLANFRRSRANYILELSPNNPVVPQQFTTEQSQHLVPGSTLGPQ